MLLSDMVIFLDIGSIQVAELDWGNEDHIRAVGPPFDYIIGTDVVSLYIFLLKNNNSELPI